MNSIEKLIAKWTNDVEQMEKVLSDEFAEDIRVLKTCRDQLEQAARESAAPVSEAKESCNEVLTKNASLTYSAPLSPATLRERLDKAFDKVVDAETRCQILNCIMPTVEQIARESAADPTRLVRTRKPTPDVPAAPVGAANPIYWEGYNAALDEWELREDAQELIQRRDREWCVALAGIDIAAVAQWDGPISVERDASATEESFREGVLFAANFLEREADANFMPNEPAQVLLKGMASAIRINMKATGFATSQDAVRREAPQLDNWIAEFSLTDESDVLDEFTLDEQAKIWRLMRIAWNTALERAASPAGRAEQDEK